MQAKPSIHAQGCEQIVTGADKDEQSEEVPDGPNTDVKDSVENDTSVDPVEKLSQGTLDALHQCGLVWDDGPSFNLFQEGTEEYNWFNEKLGVLNNNVQTPIAGVDPSTLQHSNSPSTTSGNASNPSCQGTPDLLLNIAQKPSTGSVDAAVAFCDSPNFPGPILDTAP